MTDVQDPWAPPTASPDPLPPPPAAKSRPKWLIPVAAAVALLILLGVGLAFQDGKSGAVSGSFKAWATKHASDFSDVSDNMDGATSALRSGNFNKAASYADDTGDIFDGIVRSVPTDTTLGQRIQTMARHCASAMHDSADALRSMNTHAIDAAGDDTKSCTAELTSVASDIKAAA